MNKKKINIALITNTKSHHKYWVYSLWKDYNIVAVIHPNLPKKLSIFKKIENNTRFGFSWLILRILSVVYQRFSNDSIIKNEAIHEKNFFGKYHDKYDTIPKNIIYQVNSINDAETVALIKNLNIDVICMLGGEIAKDKIIKSAKICSLNFHSGLSPFYNGMATIYWAFADFRPNFSGGTLMYISERIDGGKILAHYLPAIESSDDAASVFMKNIIGAVKLYRMALDEITRGTMPIGVKQQRTFRYIRAVDWTLIQDLRLKYFTQKNMISKYIRDESYIDYFTLAKNDNFTFSKLLQIILKS